jgi:UrcA family protein
MKIRNKGGLVATGMALMAVAMAGGAAENRGSGGAVRVENRLVRFGDLDLDKPAGLATLHARLRQAAIQVCGDTGSRLSQWVEHRNCRNQALADAIARLPAPVQSFHARWVAQGSRWTRDADLSQEPVVALRASRK